MSEPWTDEKIREAFIYDGGESAHYDPVNGEREHRRIAGDIFDRWLAQYTAEKRAVWEAEQGEVEWEYTWAGHDGEDDWVLDETFTTQGEAVEFMRTRGWILLQGGSLHRRRSAGPWEPVDENGAADREVCPQPCEHLSQHDAREGRTCPEHPCTCTDRENGSK